MAKIAFILLCHKDPESIISQAQKLTAVGDFLAIHFDASAKKSDFDLICSELGENPRVVFAKKRIKCGWGEWSLVQATLHALAAAEEAFPRATHFYMLSGDCMAIKSSEYAHQFLDDNDADYIESFDYFKSDWIKTGFKEERLVYRHFFNERSRKWFFYTSVRLQERFGLTRQIPSDLQIMIGSQWWCLRRQTIESVLDFCKIRKDVMRFFKTTWIPDETFFQTVVRHIVPTSEIRNRTLTFLMFTDYGMPVTFYNDHYDLLLGQDYLFARKISPEARELKARLGQLFAEDDVDFTISNEGRELFEFLTTRGREGRRFSQRFWETKSTLGRERELMIVACKKWHVAKRLLNQIRQITNVPAVEYVFDEELTTLPDLGGIQNTLKKRTRHRRALMRMLFDFYDSDRLVFCLDPNNLDLLKDFFLDRSKTKLLQVDCDFSDEYLTGHASRVGLIGEKTGKDTIAKLLPTIRADVLHEADRLRDENFPNYYRIQQRSSVDENAEQLAAFLSVSADKAHQVAATEPLFED